MLCCHPEWQLFCCKYSFSSLDIYPKVFHLGSPNWRLWHLKEELTTPTEINFFSALTSIANDISLSVHAWLEINMGNHTPWVKFITITGSDMIYFKKCDLLINSKTDKEWAASRNNCRVLNYFQENCFSCNQEKMQYGLMRDKYSSSQSLVNEPQVLIPLLSLVKS